MTFYSDGDRGTPSISVQAANLWYDIRDTYIVRFVGDGCRKNLPLGDYSVLVVTIYDKSPPQDREPYLALFTPDSVEHQYHATCLAILDAIEFPRTLNAANGLLFLLEYRSFVSGVVDTDVHYGPSLSDHAFLAAHVFHSHNDCPIYWRAHFRNQPLDDSTQTSLDWWVREFRNCDLVSEVR